MAIDLSEAAEPVEEYGCFQDIFIRRLRPGARAVDPDPGTLISPVDGVLTTRGEVRAGTVVQAKGIDYSLEALVEDAAVARSFEGGLFFTLYLRPKDYHRIHSPLRARLVRERTLGGALLPVKPYMIRSVPELLARNERLWLLLDGELGRVLVVCVAAAGVGTVTTEHGGQPLEKGDELAAFNLGSTVIVFCEPGRMRPAPGLTVGDEVRMGQALACAGALLARRG